MRGRQKGQTKRMSKIKDPVIAPYEIWVDEDLPVNIYPTIMFRVNEEIKTTLNGYNKKNILNEIKKY